MKFSHAFLLTSTLLSASTANAGIIPYIDQSLWADTLTTHDFTEETFDGDAADLPANTGGHAFQGFTLGLIGGEADPGPTGLNGSGFLQGEVDSKLDTTQGISLNFSLVSDSVYGFGILGFQNDSASSAGGLSLDEIGISLNGENFILSNMLGLPDPVSTDAIPFIGFISDEVINSFSIIHAAAISDVTRTSEEFFIDGLLLATLQQEPEIPPTPPVTEIPDPEVPTTPPVSEIPDPVVPPIPPVTEVPDPEINNPRPDLVVSEPDSIILLGVGLVGLFMSRGLRRSRKANHLVPA